jgi:hypothetical protein
MDLLFLPKSARHALQADQSLFLTQKEECSFVDGPQERFYSEKGELFSLIGRI